MSPVLPLTADSAGNVAPLLDSTGSDAAGSRLIGAGPSSLHDFLAALLDEQQQLQTPVARFASSQVQSGKPALEPLYRDLIPLSKPQPGEQYAFEVDLDSCSGCKACVTGCHSLNGLEENETWRDVGVVLGTRSGQPFQQTITSACHHCTDPACLNGCPVLAYEKDPVTGIVRHLDDQCMGCQYCVLKCPYDVPKYSERLGIVRKCDLCHGRLATGEAPACVQACPTHAIRVVTVPVVKVGDRLTADTSHFLSTAPDPGITSPTTRYVSARPPPDLPVAGDCTPPPLQPAHLPLVAMLVLTQVGIGLLSSAVLFAGHSEHHTNAIASGLACLVTGLAASIAHLGRPLRAWRVALNLRRSWLSREAVVFGMTLPLAFAYGAMKLFHQEERSAFFGGALLVLGGMGIVCSAMIYIDTRRRSWTVGQTTFRFAGTFLIAALAPISAPAAAATLLVKLLGELALQRTLRHDPLYGPAPVAPPPPGLRSLVRIRIALGLVAAAGLSANLTMIGMMLFVAGEWYERRLFFQTSIPSKMPGVPRG
jgi:formate dehydrogenase iron-sulfur subunit